MLIQTEDLRNHYHRHDWKGVVLAWLASPGFVVVTKLRWAQTLWARWDPISRLFARLIWRHIVRSHGCYFSLTARVGSGLTLPHPVSIVVGDGCEIGRNVTLYQGVTLGRKHSDLSGCPKVSDDVTIYAGATVIGSITLGRGATIGANTVVTTDVAEYETVAGNPARRRQRVPKNDLLQH